MRFTADYVERATLRDGTAVVIRLLAPEDRALLRRGFEQLSEESRYRRFLGAKPRLSDEELRYLCEIDQQDHFALGAIREDGDGHGNPIGLGIARFIRLPTTPDAPITAEAAIAVADELHGRGLGKLLLDRLCEAGAERGIECFRCEVLGDNRSMAQLIDAIAPDHSVEVAAGVMSFDFRLPAAGDPADPAARARKATPPRGLSELLRAAAARLLDVVRLGP